MTLTKEWLLRTIAELEEERDSVPGAVNEDAAKALEAMKIALASLEAKPVISHVGSKNALDDIVAFIKSNRNPTLKDHNQVSERLFQDNCHGLSNHVIEYIKQIGEELEELRSTQDTAPPAPVSVPDDVSGPLAHAYKELTPTFMRNHIDVFERYGIYPDGSAGIQAMRIALDGMTRRAAMLQGAEPVQGWIPCSERMPDEYDYDIWIYSPGKGVYHGVAYAGGGEFMDDECQFKIDDATHWMPMIMPAAPRQEDK